MVIIVILGAVGALVLSWIIINAKAMRIVKIHSYDLERAQAICPEAVLLYDRGTELRGQL